MNPTVATLALALSLLATADGGRAAGVPIEVTAAEAATILAAVKAPGARAVLVNIWATWCEPCREEMPDLVRFHRDHRDRGLRLIMVSADDPEQKAEVARVLGSFGFEGRAFIKQGADDAFINALEPRWSGALPATILYDARGERRRFWPGLVTHGALKGPVSQLLGKAPSRRKP
jgi:thiol-disulfide isomerase/thioredoxin